MAEMKNSDQQMFLCWSEARMPSFENYWLCQKTAPSRENGLSKPQASLLHVVCACNYIHLPLTRQHKPSVFVSRFTSSRRFLKYPTSSKVAIRRFYRRRKGKCRVLHLSTMAKNGRNRGSKTNSTELCSLRCLILGSRWETVF